MSHPSHKLKAYTGDVRKPLVFCTNCGLEEGEVSIHAPCLNTFYVDSPLSQSYPKFVSGLPYNEYNHNRKV